MNAAATRPSPYVRPDVRVFLDFIAQANAPEISTLGPAEARLRYLALAQAAEAPPRPLALIRDLTCPGPAGAIPLRLYDARESREPGPAVVFYHGGGFVVGDLESHHSLCTEIAAELDVPVIAVDYRLAPENPFPAAPDDSEAATRWIAGSPDELGRTITGLALMGDSAGGNLAIVTTQALLAKPAQVPVVLQALIYPATDGRSDHPSFEDFSEGFLLTRDAMGWFEQNYAAEAGNPRAAPILGDHSRTPPTVLVTATLDPIRDGGRAYGAALILAGAEVVFLERQGTIHGFVNLRTAVPSAQTDLAAMVAAIRLFLDRAG